MSKPFGIETQYFNIARRIHSKDDLVSEMSLMSSEEIELIFNIYRLALQMGEIKLLLESPMNCQEVLPEIDNGREAYTLSRVYDVTFRKEKRLGVEYSYYGLDRTPSISLTRVLTEIGYSKDIRLLEIGGGEGKNTLLRMSELKSAGFTVEGAMTCLNRLNHHQTISDSELSIHYGEIAEHLPESWSETFDVVMTIVCLPWTNIHYALSSIYRLLKAGGIWIDCESWDGPRNSPEREMIFGTGIASFSIGINEAINESMKRLKMNHDKTIETVIYDQIGIDRWHPSYKVHAYRKP